MVKIVFLNICMVLAAVNSSSAFLNYIWGTKAVKDVTSELNGHMASLQAVTALSKGELPDVETATKALTSIAKQNGATDEQISRAIDTVNAYKNGDRRTVRKNATNAAAKLAAKSGLISAEKANETAAAALQKYENGDHIGVAHEIAKTVLNENTLNGFQGAIDSSIMPGVLKAHARKVLGEGENFRKFIKTGEASRELKGHAATVESYLPVPKGTLAVLHSGVRAYINGEDTRKAMKDAGGLAVGKEAKSRIKGLVSSIPMVGAALSSAVDSVSILSDASDELTNKFSPKELRVLHTMIVNFAKTNAIDITVSKEVNVFDESEISAIHTMITNDKQAEDSPKPMKKKSTKSIEAEEEADEAENVPVSSLKLAGPAFHKPSAKAKRTSAAAKDAQEEDLTDKNAEAPPAPKQTTRKKRVKANRISAPANDAQEKDQTDQTSEAAPGPSPSPTLRKTGRKGMTNKSPAQNAVAAEKTEKEEAFSADAKLPKARRSKNRAATAA